MIGYGHSMRVMRQILQHVFGTAEGRLDFNHPSMTMRRTQKRTEWFFFGQWLQFTRQGKFALAECLHESVHELAPEYIGEHATREKEAIPRMNPGFVIQRQAAEWDHTMDMGMMHQVLSPGMEHAEEAKISPQVFRIDGNLQEGFCAGSKQQPIKQFLIVEHQSRQCVWKSKYEMYVRNRQQFLLTSRQPFLPGIVQTLWAMPVPAAVIRDGYGMAASTTTIPVTSE